MAFDLYMGWCHRSTNYRSTDHMIYIFDCMALLDYTIVFAIMFVVTAYNKDAFVVLLSRSLVG